MNKLMIVLGLLLIAGISFARPDPGPWQYGWQGAVAHRYDCGLYSADEQYHAAYMYMQPYATATQLFYMHNYVHMMDFAVWDSGESGMMYDYYATPFRADMAAYNSENSLFRSFFNAAYRNYMAQTGDSGGYVRSYLAGVRASYLACVSGANQ